MRSVLISFVVLSATVAASYADQPAPSAGGTPDKMPFDIPYGAPVELAKAQKLITAVEAAAKGHAWKFNIAVVDPNGDLIAFARMDGAQLASIGIAQRKARIAARFRRETRVFFNAMETGHSYPATLDPEMVASPGGFPLVADGKVIGAIGCSGGTGDQDAMVCKAGVDALAK